MTKKELQAKVDSLGPWYHTMTLVAEDGTVDTNGEPYGDVWKNTHNCISQLDYDSKSVLDLATFDGLWAFTAESLGASIVIATDCNWEAIQRFLLAKKSLNSNVIPLFNVPAHEIVNRLDSYLIGGGETWKPHDKEKKPALVQQKFDIVQHLGLFYHLRDPLQSLLQARSCLKDGGHLIIETAVWFGSDQPVMLYNPSGDRWRVYNDRTTWWAPTYPCLEEVLTGSMFKVMPETVNILKPDKPDGVGRVCLIAEALPKEKCDELLLSELHNTYRTPGLKL